MKKRKVAAVICEYNPFHEGHASLLRRLRLEEGEETAIVAIMSGNFTQRGEPAIFFKQIRAACAVRGGADLVLELPFPYSSSGAERFANAGVRIADALGVVDMLAFGSECGDTSSLIQLAEKLEAPAFQDAFFKTSERTNIGCAQKTESIYRAVYGDADPLWLLLRDPNNVLGVEYIRAALRIKSRVTPCSLKRHGMKHGEDGFPEDGGPITSASAARRGLLCTETRDRILANLPAETIDILQSAIQNGAMLSPENRLLFYQLLYYRNINRDLLLRCDGMHGGLGDRILHAAQNAETPETFFAALRSKKHTDAYLRRALLYGMFGVCREHLNAPPAYTQILAMNERGREVLAMARKCTRIPLLNRPSEIHRVSGQNDFSIRADSVYCALLEHPSLPSDQLRYRPHIEKA